MFNPLSLQEEKVLRNSGKICISVAPVWRNGQDLNSVPHNIHYTRTDPNTNQVFDDILLYTCYVTVSRCMVTFNNLKKSIFIKSAFYSSEQVMYSALKMSLEQIINWSEETGKKRLTIISAMPHIAEHFVDLKFIIKNVNTNITGKRLLS